MKARQGASRKARPTCGARCLSRLKATGKYNLPTAKLHRLSRQSAGRAGALCRSRAAHPHADRDSARRSVLPKDCAELCAVALNQLASILNLQGRWDGGGQSLCRARRGDQELGAGAPRRPDPQHRAHRHALQHQQPGGRALPPPSGCWRGRRPRFGEQHVDTALARGMLAIGLARAERDADALREFKLAMPILMAALARNRRATMPPTAAAREQRAQVVVEAYIALLGAHRARRGRRRGERELSGWPTPSAAARCSSALAASSARAAAQESGARRARAQGARIWRSRSARSSACSTTCWRCRRTSATRRRSRRCRPTSTSCARSATRPSASSPSDFRDYAEPDRSASRRRSRTSGRCCEPDEAFLSFYFGREASFVWAVPKDGAGRLRRDRRQRRATREQGQASCARRSSRRRRRSSDIPPFDLALAHELYTLLLKPVEAGWQPAKSLIVVTNGALGLLPLGAAADGAGRASKPTPSCCSPAIATCRGSRARMR